MMTLYPGLPTADGGCLIAFDGPPNRGIQWQLIAGPGVLTPLSVTTDATGRAWAQYAPQGGSGTASVEIRYGP